MRRLLLFGLLLCLIQSLWAQTFISENFNTGIPAGWIVQNGGTTTDTWFGTTGGFSGQYLDGSEFVFVNSDAAGNAANTCLDEIFRSPTVNTAGSPILLLEFDQHFRYSGQSDSGFVEVFDGNQWVQVTSFGGSVGSFALPDHQILNVTAYANTNFQFRFRYNDNCAWAWYWGVDNVLLYTPLTFDASLDAITAPNVSGRQMTSSALGTSETISVLVGNPGLDTLFNVPIWYRINNGTAVGPETVPGPIPPQTNLGFSFAAPANLSAVNTYQIEAWTELLNDANVSNDTASIEIRQLHNPALVMPFCQDFEGAADTVGSSNFIGAIAGLPELDFYTSGGPGGRLRTAAGIGYSQSGNQAITLDKSPTGSPNAINDVFLTYNLAAYDAAMDVILMDFSVIDHGDEVSANDSVWIRGTDTASWIGVSGWNTLSGGNNGVYFTLGGTDVSAMLVANGQNFSSSFQIRLGQEDNFDAASPIASDGASFDDICLSLQVNIDCGVTDILQPISQSCGDSIQPVMLQLENFGLDTLSSIPIEVAVTGTNNFIIQDTFPGPLPPGQSAVHLLYSNGFSGGNFQLCAYTQMPGDSIYSDDTTCISISLMEPQTAQVLADTLCSGDSTTLFILQPDPLFRYTWWDSLDGGNLLHTGDSLNTPPLTSDSTWYAEANSSFRGLLGPTDNTLGTGGNYGLFQDGLVFDVLQPVTIDTVFVYPGGSGVVTINILNASNVVMNSVSVSVPGSGRRAIPLGITVYPGTSYRINASGSTVSGLYRNDTSAVYPYILQNVLSISNTINGNGSLGFYYFFYDWRVSIPGCAGARTPVTVSVLDNPPTAGFSLVTNQTTVNFTDTTNGSVQTWQWDFGDNNTSTLQNPTHTYTNPGDYPVCLISSNACGSDTICDTVTVCAPLVPGFVSIQSALNVVFNDTSAGAISWQWTFGDGNTDSVANPSHTYLNEGIYQVCLQVSNICQQSDSICDSVAVCTPLLAGFNFIQQPGNGLEYAFSDLSLGIPTSYFWDFGDGGTSTQSNPNHIYTQTGAQTVTLILTNACDQSDTSVQMLNVVGIEDGVFVGMQVAPNPSTDVFRVQLPEMNMQTLEMRVRDLNDRVIWSGQWAENAAPNQIKIDLSGVATGIYLLEVETDGKRALRRLNRI